MRHQISLSANLLFLLYLLISLSIRLLSFRPDCLGFFLSIWPLSANWPQGFTVNKNYVSSGHQQSGLSISSWLSCLGQYLVLVLWSLACFLQLMLQLFSDLGLLSEWLQKRQVLVGSYLRCFSADRREGPNQCCCWTSYSLYCCLSTLYTQPPPFTNLSSGTHPGPLPY